MSISNEALGSHSQFPNYEAHPRSGHETVMYVLQCRTCGYEPFDMLIPPSVCPKCHRNTWERIPRPGSLLDNADRF